MKRKFLEDMGLEKEQIDKILDENSQDIGKAKGDLDTVQDKLKAAEDEIETLKGQVKDRDGQLETLKNSTGDVDDLKKQIEDLQKDNKAKDDAHAAEIKKLQREAVDNELLIGAKAKNNKAVLALLDEIEDTVDIDGYKTKRSEQIEAILKSDSYLFETKNSKKQVKGAEPGESGNEDSDNGVDTSKMSYSELAAYLAENPDAKVD